MKYQAASIILCAVTISCASSHDLEQRIITLENRVHSLENDLGREVAAKVFTDEAAPAEAMIHDVDHVIGETKFANGDFIEIHSVRSDRNTFEVGGTYEVRGRYRLTSHNQGKLVLSITSTGPNYRGSIAGERAVQVLAKGEGLFTLIRQFSYPGLPHVTFYGVDTGRPFGGLYFGVGEWLND